MLKRKAKKIASFSQQDITSLRKTSKFIHAAQGIRILAACSLSTSSRILIIVPGKSGSSPERNLIKRRIKSIFYEENFTTAGYDYVVIVKKPGIHTSFADLKTYLLLVKNKLQNSCTDQK